MGGRGGRGRSSRGAGGECSTLLLSATGEFKKRIRRQLEGVPEMIIDVKKALTSGEMPNRYRWLEGSGQLQGWF